MDRFEKAKETAEKVKYGGLTGCSQRLASELLHALKSRELWKKVHDGGTHAERLAALREAEAYDGN